MSLNDDILDLVVSHQVGVQRFASGIVSEILDALKQVEADIIGKIRDLGDDASDFSKRRLEAQLKSIQSIMKEASGEMYDKMANDLDGLAHYESDFTIKSITKPSPFALDVVAPSAEQLSAAVTSEPLQGKYLKEWTSEWGEGAYRRVRNELRVGYVQGETIDEMVRRIKGTKANNYTDGVMEISRRSATTLVRTAVNDVSNTARGLVYESNADIIDKWMFVATLDSRTTVQCAALDGQTFPVGEGPVPPRHPNCRSTTVPITKSFKELGLDVEDSKTATRASKDDVEAVDGQVPESKKYGDWLDAQPVSVQNHVLGETRATLFRKGDLPLERMLDSMYEPMTLDELRRKEADAFKKAGLW